MTAPNPVVPPGLDLAPQLPDRTKAGTIGSPDLKVSDEAIREAYERGGDAGMREKEDEENPYPEGSVLAKAFEHGYLDGQKAQR
ncbi:MULTISPECIES: hypothetical protein [Rhizobium]|uniref:Uncharacterized protein n=1 Tax=Rhizobium miluonense TaxID=411945 RepID=A0A1C3WR35_9HYPH|nr:hypothetical protein [Rhizobium miluonense]SCB42431.1 hypothetical protein GA0061102_103721 [Rhizobium miluonense]